MLQEIFLRTTPYAMGDLSSEEIVEKVRNHDTQAKYFR